MPLPSEKYAVKGKVAHPPHYEYVDYLKLAPELLACDSTAHGIIQTVIMTCLERNLETINISEAKSRFSEFLSRAASGERFIILRRERPLAAIIGAGELECLERAAEITRRLARSLGQSAHLIEDIEVGKVHPAMAAFGLWKDEEDLADLDARVAENRRRATSRRHVDL